MKCLLFTWKDIFNIDPETMPVTDSVIHTIPTYSHIRPWRSKDKVYTQKEVQWQRENIPRLLNAGVISYCDSPWSARIKHPVKKDGTLRMVNIFCPINEVTIKSNYPMKRIESIVNTLSQEKYKSGSKFQSDASNGYYAVPLWREHAYKTAFSCSLGQFCYNVMGQGLSGAPHTYSCLKDLAMGCIPAPNEEPSIQGETVVKAEDNMAESQSAMGGWGQGSVAYEYFLDDDYGVATDFKSLLWFLHELCLGAGTTGSSKWENSVDGLLGMLVCSMWVHTRCLGKPSTQGDHIFPVVCISSSGQPTMASHGQLNYNSCDTIRRNVRISCDDIAKKARNTRQTMWHAYNCTGRGCRWLCMCVPNAQDARGDAVCAPASRHQFVFLMYEDSFRILVVSSAVVSDGIIISRSVTQVGNLDMQG